MKTRDKLRLRKRNVSFFDAMLNDSLPREERITLLHRLLAGRRSGGKAGRDKARAKSLLAARIEAWAPLAEDFATYSDKVSDAALAGYLHRLLTEPYPDDPYVVAILERDDLWPKGVPSLTRFRELIAELDDSQRRTLHLPNRDGPTR